MFSVQGSGHFQGDGLVEVIFSISICISICLALMIAFTKRLFEITLRVPRLTGYAQMTSAIGKDKSPEFGSSCLSGVFSVEWIKKYVLHVFCLYRTVC